MVFKLYDDVLVVDRKNAIEEVCKGNFVLANVCSITRNIEGKVVNESQIETLSLCQGTVVKAQDKEGNIYTYEIPGDGFPEKIFLSKDYAKFLLTNKKKKVVAKIRPELKAIDKIIEQLE